MGSIMIFLHPGEILLIRIVFWVLTPFQVLSYNNEKEDQVPVLMELTESETRIPSLRD